MPYAPPYKRPREVYGDGDVKLVPCLVQLTKELEAHPYYGPRLWNLGSIGDTAHKGQGFGSDHNPFVVHKGVGWVRAIDIGGPKDVLLQLRDELHKLYVEKDARVWKFGYFKGPDSLINDWGGSGWHIDTGDEGHLHISVSQADGYNPSRNGWVPALSWTRPWLTSAAPPKPLVITTSTGWPYKTKPGHCFGLRSGPANWHGGATTTERVWVRYIENAMKTLVGYKGNTDGVYDELLTASVKKYQIKKKFPTRSGRVGPGTWAAIQRDLKAKGKK